MYFPIEGDQVAAYELSSGAPRWTVSARPQSAPAAGGGLLFIEQPGVLTAIHAGDGSAAWEVPLPEKLAVPLVWNNGWLVAGTPGALLAFHADSGSPAWRHDLASSPHAPPVLAGDRAYVPTDDGRVVALRADNGDLVWERRLGGAANRILVVDDRLFVGSNDNYLYCLRTRDGEIDWRSPRTGADVVDPPAVDEHRVYFVSFDNVLRALSRSNGVQQWKVPLPYRPTGSPILAVDALLVAGLAGPLRAYYLKDGTPADAPKNPAGLAGDTILPMGIELAAPLHAMNGVPLTLGPIVVIITRGPRSDSTAATAFSRSIDPPVADLTPLPDIVPVAAPVDHAPPDR